MAELDLYYVAASTREAQQILRDRRFPLREDGESVLTLATTMETCRPGPAIHLVVPKRLAHRIGGKVYQVDPRRLSREHIVGLAEDRLVALSLTVPAQADTSIQPTAAPVTMHYLRNTDTGPKPTTGYGQDIEPRGRYLVEGSPTQPVPDGWERGDITFKNPLHLPFGGEYGHPTNWKSKLSAQFGGLTGRALSDAVVAAGHDGIVTHDKYGTAEILDLTGLRPQAAAPQNYAEYMRGRRTKGDPERAQELYDNFTPGSSRAYDFYQPGEPWKNRPEVAWVRTDKLLPYREHTGDQNADSEQRIQALTEDFKAGRGFVDPLQVEYHPGRHTMSLGEGNHRLMAAHRAGVPYVPAVVWPMSDYKDKGSLAPFSRSEVKADVSDYRAHSPRDVFPEHWLMPEQKHAGRSHEVYQREHEVRPYMALPQLAPADAGSLFHRVLRENGMGQHLHDTPAEAVELHPNPTNSAPTYDYGTAPHKIGLALGADMHDELTVLHEAAHVLRQNGQSGQQMGMDQDSTHDPEWEARYRGLVEQYGSHRTRAQVDRLFPKNAAGRQRIESLRDESGEWSLTPGSYEIPISELKPLRGHGLLHGTDDVRALTDDIRHNGVRDPIILSILPQGWTVGANGEKFYSKKPSPFFDDGHHTLYAAEQAGLTHVPVDVHSDQHAANKAVEERTRRGYEFFDKVHAASSVTAAGYADSPARWQARQQAWDKQRPTIADTKKVGPYTLHVEQPRRGDWMIHAVHENGTYAGQAFMGDSPKEGHIDLAPEVHPEHRRRGVASAMYDWAQELTGKPVAPGADQTQDAKNFWQNRRKGTAVTPADPLRGVPADGKGMRSYPGKPMTAAEIEQRGKELVQGLAQHHGVKAPEVVVQDTGAYDGKYHGPLGFLMLGEHRVHAGNIEQVVSHEFTHHLRWLNGQEVAGENRHGPDFRQHWADVHRSLDEVAPIDLSVIPESLRGKAAEMARGGRQALVDYYQKKIRPQAAQTASMPLAELRSLKTLDYGGAPITRVRKAMEHDWKTSTDSPRGSWRDYSGPAGYLDHLTKQIKSNGITEPVKIGHYPDGKSVIYDGTHRALIAHELGIESVPVEHFQMVQGEHY